MGDRLNRLPAIKRIEFRAGVFIVRIILRLFCLVIFDSQA
jgi:hypothetical protein